MYKFNRHIYGPVAVFFISNPSGSIASQEKSFTINYIVCRDKIIKSRKPKKKGRVKLNYLRIKFYTTLSTSNQNNTKLIINFNLTAIFIFNLTIFHTIPL